MNASSPIPDPHTTRTVAVTVNITCPAWCEISAEDHAAALWDNEGRCVHQLSTQIRDPVGKRVWDEDPRFCAPFELRLDLTTNPAGHQVESPDIFLNDHLSNLDQLVRLGDAIKSMAAIYESTTAHAP